MWKLWFLMCLLSNHSPVLDKYASKTNWECTSPIFQIRRRKWTKKKKQKKKQKTGNNKKKTSVHIHMLDKYHHFYSTCFNMRNFRWKNFLIQCGNFPKFHVEVMQIDKNNVHFWNMLWERRWMRWKLKLKLRLQMRSAVCSLLSWINKFWVVFFFLSLRWYLQLEWTKRTFELEYTRTIDRVKNPKWLFIMISKWIYGIFFRF